MNINIAAHPKIALILSGSGHIDGTEITEAVSLNIALNHLGFDVDFYAPDRDQKEVVNHLTKKTQQETRNILVEAARIARGKIQPLEALQIKAYQAIALAGGFGAVKNFTTFLEEGIEGRLLPDIHRIFSQALQENIIIAGICAAPLVMALAAKEAGITGFTLTFGQEDSAADFIHALTHWGGIHQETKIDEAYVDPSHKFISSGAYMFSDANAYEIYRCAEATAEKIHLLLKQFK